VEKGDLLIETHFTQQLVDARVAGDDRDRSTRLAGMSLPIAAGRRHKDSNCEEVSGEETTS
jgi:hypothetical protein